MPQGAIRPEARGRVFTPDPRERLTSPVNPPSFGDYLSIGHKGEPKTPHELWLYHPQKGVQVYPRKGGLRVHTDIAGYDPFSQTSIGGRIDHEQRKISLASGPQANPHRLEYVRKILKRAHPDYEVIDFSARFGEIQKYNLYRKSGLSYLDVGHEPNEGVMWWWHPEYGFRTRNVGDEPYEVTHGDVPEETRPFYGRYDPVLHKISLIRSGRGSHRGGYDERGMYRKPSPIPSTLQRILDRKWTHKDKELGDWVPDILDFDEPDEDRYSERYAGLPTYWDVGHGDGENVLWWLNSDTGEIESHPDTGGCCHGDFVGIEKRLPFYGRYDPGQHRVSVARDTPPGGMARSLPHEIRRRLDSMFSRQGIPPEIMDFDELTGSVVREKYDAYSPKRRGNVSWTDVGFGDEGELWWYHPERGLETHPTSGGMVDHIDMIRLREVDPFQQPVYGRYDPSTGTVGFRRGSSKGGYRVPRHVMRAIERQWPEAEVVDFDEPDQYAFTEEVHKYAFSKRRGRMINWVDVGHEPPGFMWWWSPEHGFKEHPAGWNPETGKWFTHNRNKLTAKGDWSIGEAEAFGRVDPEKGLVSLRRRFGSKVGVPDEIFDMLKKRTGVEDPEVVDFSARRGGIPTFDQRGFWSEDVIPGGAETGLDWEDIERREKEPQGFKTPKNPPPERKPKTSDLVTLYPRTPKGAGVDPYTMKYAAFWHYDPESGFVAMPPSSSVTDVEMAMRNKPFFGHYDPDLHRVDVVRSGKMKGRSIPMDLRAAINAAYARKTGEPPNIGEGEIGYCDPEVLDRVLFCDDQPRKPRIKREYPEKDEAEKKPKFDSPGHTSTYSEMDELHRYLAG